MRILNGSAPQQTPNGQQPPQQAAAAHAPAAAAPPVAPAPAVYYEYRDPLLSASAPAPAVPAAAQSVREEPKAEKKHEKPAPSPLGRRTRAARDVNSDDERLQRPQPNTEESLSSLLKRKGYEIRRMAEDGNCLFRCGCCVSHIDILPSRRRAIADQVYGDPEMHDVVRKNAMDYIVRFPLLSKANLLTLVVQEKERTHFSQWVTEDIATYIARKRQPSVFGNNIEIQACIEIYNRPCEVYSAVSGESAHPGVS